MSTFAELLRHHRLRHDWGMNELARRAGMEESTVSRWEAGNRQPFLDNVERLARALGLSPWERAQFLVAGGFIPQTGTVVIVDGVLIAWHADQAARDGAA